MATGFQRLSWIVAPAVVALAAACMPRAGAGARPQAIDMPPQPSTTDEATDPASSDGEPAPVATPEARDEPTTPPPIFWTQPVRDRRSYAEALRSARTTKTAFEGVARTVAAGADGGAPPAEQFERANALLEQTSRNFAGAYHATDATPASRIDTLREAATMLLAWALRLDELGLARVPATYRANTAIALTFEDVVNGPAKRWREEGLGLVQLCAETAPRPPSAAARECAALKQRYVRVLRRPSRSGDAGAGCACDPGDPLCSATMSGWCR